MHGDDISDDVAVDEAHSDGYRIKYLIVRCYLRKPIYAHCVPYKAWDRLST